MTRTFLTFLGTFLCVSCFLLEDQKPTSDHDLIRYLDNVVTNLVNLTGKLGSDIATKNDLTQFLQSDLQQLNLTLQEEKQKRQTLEIKVTQLETRLVMKANVFANLSISCFQFFSNGNDLLLWTGRGWGQFREKCAEK